jgi:hypothetical protein
VLLIHEPGPSRQEVTEAVRAAPHVTTDEPGLEVVGDDRLPHLIGGRVLCSMAKYARSVVRISLSDGRSPTPGGYTTRQAAPPAIPWHARPWAVVIGLT